MDNYVEYDKHEREVTANYRVAVSALIHNSNDEVLALQKSGLSDNSNFWCYPGDKVAKGETSKEAVERIIIEQLGLDMTGILSTAMRYDIRPKSRKDLPELLDIWHFYCDLDINKVKLQNEKFNDIKFVSKEELMEMKNDYKFTFDGKDLQFFDAINYDYGDKDYFIHEMVIVDVTNKLGSIDPDKGFIYTYNYGRVKNEMTREYENIDAYILNVKEPLDTFYGFVPAVIHRTNNNGDVLIVQPYSSINNPDEVIRDIIVSKEQQYESTITRVRKKYKEYKWK